MKLTKLEAVNQILACAGMMPVNSIDEPTTSDAALVVQMLEVVHREVLSHTWHINTEYEVTLEVNHEGRIVVPDSILRFQVEDQPWVIHRGSTLYDRENKTDRFETAVTGWCVRWLPWDELSEELKTYITALCKVRYYSAFVGVDQQADLLRTEALIAQAACTERDADTANYSIFDSPDIGQGLLQGNQYITGAPRLGHGILDNRTPKR